VPQASVAPSVSVSQAPFAPSISVSVSQAPFAPSL
jgi:hypothetical protein